MRSAVVNLFFLLSFSVVTDSHAQIKSIGLPSIVNHYRSDYNAGTQNWSITQSRNGFLYFGNNDGIIEYDGTDWTTYQVPNSSVVRSVLAVGDTIYCGAFEEIGFLAPDTEGKLKYHSLSHLIPVEFSAFDEIWNIYESDGTIIFQSYEYIFILKDEQFRVIKPLSRFSMLHFVNDRLYIVDTDNGLMLIDNGDLKLVSNHPVFFRNEIRYILSLGNNELLIGTSNEGLFRFSMTSGGIVPWDTEVNRALKVNTPFSGFRLSNGYYAFGSVSDGIFISNREGSILQHINRYRGLQNNTILSLFEDRRNNLWLGLDNGIDYLEISSPMSFLNYNYNIESAYASLVHNGILYIGTNQGLYAGEFQGFDMSFSNIDKFQLIRGTEGQVWSLEVIDNVLFCGHNFGCFQINGFTARQISDIRGFWSFTRSRENASIIIAGTYSGLVTLTLRNDQWVFLKEVEGFSESSRSIYMDHENNLWISHGYRGLYKLKLNSYLDSVIDSRLLIAESGLPEQLPYNIQVVNSDMYVTTQEGIVKYNYTSGLFIKADWINLLFDSKGFIDKIHQDRSGNLWYFTTNYIGIMRLLEDGNYIDVVSPFSIVNEILIPAFQNIFIYDSNNIFIGSQRGLIHYSPNIIRDYHFSEEAYIKEATFYDDQKKSISWFTGNIMNVTDVRARTLAYSLNSVMFRFTSPAFESPEKVRFSYRLVGFDMDWSDWTGINFKEYTNLLEGDYTFQVRTVNAFNSVSEIRSFHFSVKPPLLRSRVAYAIYTLLLGMIIIGNFYYIRKRILMTRLREKLRHEKRLARREEIFKEQTALSEKEIVHLRNEGLTNEMKFKNKELANATLHLIQKNKTLGYLKEDLNTLIKTIPGNSQAKESINSLLKKINRDLRNEKNWEVFNNYFDEVHQDFIARLKERYTELTPKELRLCAYLRMNISTKEIAPLLNISVRGVEISRYRLRKKLKLGHDTNLTEFLMTF